MRIQIISDIHADFHPEMISVRNEDGTTSMKKHYVEERATWFFTEVLRPTGDVLVIAGDLGEYKYIYPYLTEAAKHWPHIIYVTGNHEYWNCKGYRVVKAEVERAIKKCPNIHWLLDTVVEIDGQRFLGNTLWYPETAETDMLKWKFRDFHAIKGNIRSPWMFRDHNNTRRFLRKNLQEGDVVVTHHAPCTASVSDRFKHSEFNCYYASDQTSLMFMYKPAVWIHGHIHEPVDYEIGDTRVVSNPFGYCGHEVIRANSKDFCVEV